MCSTPPSLRATPSKTEGEFLFAEVTIGSSPVLGEVSRSDGGVGLLYIYSLLILITGFSFAIFQVFTTTTPTIISKVTKPVMI